MNAEEKDGSQPAEIDGTVPTVGHGLMDDEAAHLYGVFADLSEVTIDPWVCADLANFTVGYIIGKYGNRPGDPA